MTFRSTSCARRSLRILRIALLAIAGSAPAIARTPFVPNDPYFSADASIGFPGQWYLVNRAPSTLTFTYTYYGRLYTIQAVNVGLDANLAAAWQRGLTGKGVVIGIVGTTGFQGDHPDLVDNYRADLSRQFSQDSQIGQLPQGPVARDDNHDTPVAGIAAARGGNGIGMTGAAPLAGVAGFRVDNRDNTVNPASNQNYVDANYFASGVTAGGQVNGYPDVSVRNRSYSRFPPFVREDPRVIRSLVETADNNVVHVFAAGNWRGSPNGDTGRMQGNSLPTAIAVAAIGSDGVFANDSNYGAALFVTAPGAQLNEHAFLAPSIDRTGSTGYCPGGNIAGDPFPDPNYTSIFSGTSATAPIVSGIVALGKELNPFLDVRWARHALAVTSHLIDPNDPPARGGWQTNGAGLSFNPNYGFGLVDAGAFVDKIEQIAYITAPQEYRVDATTPAEDNRALSLTPKTEPITLDAPAFATSRTTRLPLEAVEIALDITSANRDALQGTLVSPAGTRSTFMTTSNQFTEYLPVLGDTEPGAGLQWTFVANNFWGEDPFGTWKLSIADLGENQSRWNRYALTFHLGQMVLESGALAVSGEVTARSVVLDFASTNMSIANGATLSVRDEVWINDGTLRVDGRLQNDTAAGLARSCVRLKGGQLCGTGTLAPALGTINTGSVVRPGDSHEIGALTLEGGYTQETSGTLEIDIGANGRADSLVVQSGDVKLGGTLRLVALPEAALEGGAIIQIVRTKHPIEGAFERIETATDSAMRFRRSASEPTVFSVEAYYDRAPALSPPYRQAAVR